MSAIGTELPIRDVRVSISIGSKADYQQTVANGRRRTGQ